MRAAPERVAAGGSLQVWAAHTSHSASCVPPLDFNSRSSRCKFRPRAIQLAGEAESSHTITNEKRAQIQLASWPLFSQRADEDAREISSSSCLCAAAHCRATAARSPLALAAPERSACVSACGPSLGRRECTRHSENN